MPVARAVESARERRNRRFDDFIGLDLRVAGRWYGSWRVFSVAGFGAAAIVWLAVGLARHLPLPALALTPIVPAVMFSAHRRQVLRSERSPRLVYHRHVAAWGVVLLPLLAVFGWLSLALIDTLAPALLVGLAVGRLGCFRTGCCAGRVGSIGPLYPWFAYGARQLPLQLIDGAVCVLLAAAAIAAAAGGARPGLPAVIGLGGYLAVRCLLDELREERSRTRRHTEAQRLAVAAAALGAAWGIATLALTSAT